MDLYIHRDGKQLGPFPEATVRQMSQKDEISGADLVWHEGAPQWMTLTDFLGAQASATARTAAAPPVAGANARPAPAPLDEMTLARRLAGINGVEDLTAESLQSELQRGGRFVIYQYCISILVMTFKRPSGVYFIRGGQSGFNRGLGFSAFSLFCGWWGIPWGPIWTVTTLVNNLGGGKDVTPNVLAALNQRR